MMFSKLLVFLAAAATASAVPFSPESVLTQSLVPFTDRTIATDNTTSTQGALVDPTILFCPSANCVGCFRLSITDRLQQTCLASIPPTFVSVGIENPDGRWLPYTIWVSFVGSTCPAGNVQIPQTNVCYNVSPAGNGWRIQNTGGGTF